MTDKQPDALLFALGLEASGQHSAAAELRRLHAENEALRADAERYRWLRSTLCFFLLERIFGIEIPQHGPTELDSAIDTAMKGTQ